MNNYTDILDTKNNDTFIKLFNVPDYDNEKEDLFLRFIYDESLSINEDVLRQFSECAVLNDQLKTENENILIKVNDLSIQIENAKNENNEMLIK